METQEKNNTEQMKAFNESLTIIINNMNKLDKQMGEVSDDVAMVAEDLQSATQEIKKLKKRPKAEESTNTEIEKQQAEQALSKALIANPLYAVHAIIPGRAWLKNKEGKTLTVTEGDALDKYGKILVIDAPTGVVVTSSGVILRQ
jgi:septal ring factor EnvC (AmiA/AmiB activator)